MSEYMTEEEQIESMKRWWKKHQDKILTVVTIVLVVVAGVKYWGWHHDKVTQQASSTYEQLILAVAHDDGPKIQAYANNLTKNYSATVYADAARLYLAKFDVDNGKRDNAQIKLTAVKKNAKVPALRQIARIRLARILSSKNQYQQALNELKQVDDKSYLAVIQELKGDIYASSGNVPKAVVAYKEALVQARLQGIANPYLEMKSESISAVANTSQHQGGSQNPVVKKA